MSDLAALDLRFHTEGADSANPQLDQIADRSAKAEKATDALSSSVVAARGARSF